MLDNVNGGNTSISPIVNGKRQPLYGRDVQLTWICTKSGKKRDISGIQK